MANKQGSVTECMREIEKLKSKSETVLKRLTSDAKNRVPGWVATEVAKTYNIKKSEITPDKTSMGKKMAGRVRVQGDTVSSLQIIYRGRVLTPVHFGMTPKVPKESYTLKAEIIKGNKVTLGQKKKLTKKQRQNIGKNFRRQGTRSSQRSPIMLMPTGSSYVPFQRKSTDRKDIEVIRTLSMPQMITSDRTRDNINQAINDGLEKRLVQHMKLLEK